MPARRMLAILSILVATLTFAPAALADAPGVYAITGGTVHPVSGPAIANGTVVIRDGLLEAVGANVTVPSDATVIDAKGLHVYPGLFDAQTSLGFSTPTRGRGESAAASEPTPDSLAIRTIKLSESDAEAKRATGVTTILAAPANGIFNGQSVVLNLGKGAVESRVLKNPAALHISFSPRPTWTFPDSLMGVMAMLRQTFLDADQYGQARAIYERNPAGLRRPDDNPSLEALGPVLRRDLPVVFVADTANMIHRAQSLAKEFNLRYIISGARQGYRAADELRNVPVLVSVKWPNPPTNAEDREEQSLRAIRDRQLAPTTPATLVKAGVAFALVSGAGKTGDYLSGIRKAIENGLSEDDALRATTMWPARIFGVDRQIGTLERGKIANLVVTDLPIFAEKAKVRRVFIDGRELKLPEEEKKDAADKTAGAAASPIDGTWNLNVRASDGNVAINVTLRLEDGKLTGSFSGDRGSGELRGGTFADGAVEFTISAQAKNEAEQSDWVFRGKVTGDAMDGNVTTTLGTFAFSGSKSK